MSFQDYAESARSKLRLGDINPRLAIGIAALAVILIIVAANSLSWFFGGSNVAAAKEEAGFQIESEESAEGEVAQSSGVSEQICVYVCGCVNAPGICYLDVGSRIADAVAACGGMTPEAAAESINLAKPLEDGEQIDILSTEEIAAQMEGAQALTEPLSDSVSNQATSLSASSANDKVNINTATSADLQTISGIGPSKADKIIAYRQANGSFKSVDDLTNVSGIGKKTLEAIRDSICV